VLVGTIKNRQHKKYSMLAVGIRARQQKKLFVLAGGHPLVERAISTGSKLLAGAASGSKDMF
jgi:hypothetical protein